MSNYGRNLEFRIAPQRGQRNGAFVNNTGSAIPLGVPVGVTGDDADELGRRPIELVTGATAPEPGTHGVLLVEHTAPTGMAGRDPFLDNYSDVDTCPDGTACMLVSGEEVKLVLRNTEDREFLHTRSYSGRTMVDGLGATPTVAAGDYLTPGTGNDDDGYWAETADADNAWLVVTDVDTTRGEVTARLRF